MALRESRKSEMINDQRRKLAEEEKCAEGKWVKGEGLRKHSRGSIQKDSSPNACEPHLKHRGERCRGGYFFAVVLD